MSARKKKAKQEDGRGFCRARANIALAKYWGKSDVALNLPSVPSISLTLDRLVTETTVTFDASLKKDFVELDHKEVSGRPAARVTELLNRVRKEAGHNNKAWVVTHNKFPTAAGLASSASGFAALAGAASMAAGLDWSEKKMSAAARQSSASAARSIFGGFAELPAGKPGNAKLAAKQLETEDYWDVRIVVAVAARGAKKIGSTVGMEQCRKTSPFYQPWVDAAPKWARSVRKALRNKDLDALGAAMERSTLAFHACGMASAPPILYWHPATLAAFRAVGDMRERGISAWATMDAGPHVKVLCHAKDTAKVQRALRKTEGVLQVITTKPGKGIELSRG